MASLHFEDECFTNLYHGLKNMEFDQVIDNYKEISEVAMLIYIRASFRRYYDRDILPDDEIGKITLDNYKDYIEELDRKKAEQERLAQAGQ